MKRAPTLAGEGVSDAERGTVAPIRREDADVGAAVTGHRRGVVRVAVDHDDAAHGEATCLGGQLVEHATDRRLFLVRRDDDDNRREFQLPVPSVELGDGRVVTLVKGGRE